MANPLQFDKYLPTRPECQHCEELLADAVDNLLSPEDQTRFEAHIATCDQCSAAFADAVRGAAWLHVLKTPRPEPSSHLLDRILAVTSEAPAAEPAQPAFEPLFGIRPPALQPYAAVLEPIRPAANVLPFRPRLPQWNAIQRVMFEPRLAMTAAMAFFSIALTLNLTGIRLNQLHASDLTPSAIRRQYFQTTAAVARRTESLRVVHVLEARAADLRDVTGRDDNEVDQTPLGGIRERDPQPAQPPTQQTPQPGKPKPDPNGVSRGNAAIPRFLPVTLGTRAPHRTGGLV